jgi:tRNA threonylcarbamoyladenosine biosynthesis protein TsaB
MRVIAIETSGTQGSVALVEAGGRVLGEETFEKGLRHGQALVPAIARVLDRAGVAKRDVDLFAVGTGPGSYTGLRVGIATAKALAFALGRPLLGAPSFDAMAAATPPELVGRAASAAVAVEARREHLYVGRYAVREGRLAREEAFDVVAPDRALAGLARPVLVIGDAIARYPALRAADVIEAPEALRRPHAREVARLALERAARGERDDLHAVAPLYLRASIPEEKREKGAT